MSQRKQKAVIPIILAIIGALLLLFAIFLIFPRASEPEPIESVSQSSTSHDEETFPEISRVSLVDSKAAFDEGSAIFLDVRERDAFTASHVPNAINIPLAELEMRLGELDKAQWIISYCT